MKNEFEQIEKYIGDLDALQHYTEVKAERDSLAAKVAGLTETVTKLKDQVSSKASAQWKLAAQLRESESMAKELGGELEKAQKELSSLREFKVKVPGDSGVTLAKLKEKFLQAQQDEIETKVKERMQGLERDFRSKMPALVQKELIKKLNSPNRPPEIDKVVNEYAGKIADELLHDKKKWPEWFKDYFIQQVEDIVNKQMDSEFETKVKAEAQKRLEDIKTGQWERYTADKAKALAVNLRSLVNELRGTRWFTCDRCGRRLAMEIGQTEIAQLLGNKTVDINCSTCLDQASALFFLNTIPHKVATLTLAGLLQSYLGEAPATN